MNTQVTRVTRKEAALLAGVHPRTINRWSALGYLTVYRNGWREAATYDRREVIAAAQRHGHLKGLLPESS